MVRHNALAKSVPFEEGSPLQPDAILPSQYIDMVGSTWAKEPERRLMLAVLADAVRCFQENIFAKSKHGKKLHRAAERWIFCPEKKWLFSFYHICEALNLNPYYLKKGLWRWRKRQMEKKYTRRKNNEDSKISCGRAHLVPISGRVTLAGTGLELL